MGEVHICHFVFDKSVVHLCVLFRKGITKSNAKGVILSYFIFRFSLLAALGL